MRTIWKWALEVTDRQEVPLRAGAQVLSVQVQDGTPQLWALVDDIMPVERRMFATYGTGNPIPRSDALCKFIDTYQLDGGRLVFHVFELSRGAAKP